MKKKEHFLDNLHSGVDVTIYEFPFILISIFHYYLLYTGYGYCFYTLSLKLKHINTHTKLVEIYKWSIIHLLFTIWNYQCCQSRITKITIGSNSTMLQSYSVAIASI